jgi:hypothetical protein
MVATCQRGTSAATRRPAQTLAPGWGATCQRGTSAATHRPAQTLAPGWGISNTDKHGGYLSNGARVLLRAGRRRHSRLDGDVVRLPVSGALICSRTSQRCILARELGVANHKLYITT